MTEQHENNVKNVEKINYVLLSYDITLGRSQFFRGNTI